jgi:hypothetical protein
MAPPPRAVTRESLGAWLLKTDPASTPVPELVAGGFRSMTSRCVRRSYRTELMAPGQLVLLWVSGRDPHFPAGIYASGGLTGPVQEESLEVPVELRPIEPPVLRTELLEDPVLARIEVLRMPAGSNPSYLTAEELDRLRDGWPQMRDR